MSFQAFAQVPLGFQAQSKDDVRSQFGAICYRYLDRKAQILLVTSRGTGRWIVPKGWPVPGETPAGSARTEAFEEAGVEGVVHPTCVGLYSYTKECISGPDLPCVVALYALRVRKVLRKFPECSQRKRKWFSIKRAAAQVAEQELQEIIRNFDPRLLEI